MPGMWLRDGPDEFTTETMSAEHTDLPISRTLRIRGTRQNVSTDHRRQNVELSHSGDCTRSAPLSRPATERRRTE